MIKNGRSISVILVFLVCIALGGIATAEDIGFEAAGELVINQSTMNATPAEVSLANGPNSSVFNVTQITGVAAPADNYTWVINGFPVTRQTTPRYTHQFETPGIFPVSLIAENYTWLRIPGHTEAKDEKNLIGNFKATVPIEGYFNNSTTAVPFQIYFNYTFNNTRYRGIPTNWRWQFSNSTGIFDTRENTVANFTYAFPVSPVNNTYTVSCRAYNTTGFVVDNYTTKPVEVTTVPLIRANFTYTNETCPAFPVDVSFRDNSTYGSFLTVDSQYWDFGDGTNTTQNNPTHQYHRPGTYPVNYTAINTTYHFQNSTIQNLPTSGLFANFTYDMNPASGEFIPGLGIRVNFTSTSEGSPTNFLWNFGDNINPDSPVTLIYANHTYMHQGIYNASLTVYKTCGDTRVQNTTVRQISVIETMIANYTYRPNSGAYPLPVQFLDTTSDSPVQWEWWFYDASGILMNYTNIQNPTWVYNAPGSYRVVLHTVNGRGQTGTKDSSIVLYPGIAADFTADKTKGTFPLLVNFTDNSTPAGQPTNWLWAFGEEPGSTLQNANHTFGRKGNFTVSLTASNSQSSDTETKPAFISVGTTLTPAFTPTGLVPARAPFIVNFTDASTPADEVSGWQWTFSDGGSGAGRTVSHQFPAQGVYNVTLNVTSYWDTKSVTGQVNITEVKEPVADFIFTPLTLNAGETVTFSDRSIGPGPLNWSWQFGDGGNSTTQSPMYTYQYAGRYYPSLTVNNPYGTNTTVSTIPVSVRGPVIPSFITDKPDWWSVINQPVTFIDTSKGQPVSWVWDFADGTAPVTVATSQIVHTYTKYGTYNVTMTATNWVGDTKTAFHSFEVTNKDVPRDVNFNTTGQKYSGNHPLTVRFEDQTPAQSNIIEWYWDYGDGSNEFFTTPTSPTHTYTTPGEYTVTLTVRNDMGVNEKIRVGYVVVV